MLCVRRVSDAFHFPRVCDPPVPSSLMRGYARQNVGWTYWQLGDYSPETQEAPKPSSDLCAVAPETWEK